jgi:predicted neuraminidase
MQIWSGDPPTPSCHAATIAELSAGKLIAAWFGGTHEGHPDTAIWSSRWDGERWSAPVVLADEPEVPLWNPVLFKDAADTLWLFYKVGPTIPAWSGCYRQSRDGGISWSAPAMLPAGLIGPAKNKPITLGNGDILCGASAESWRNWTAWTEISADGGQSWTRHGPVTAPGLNASEGKPGRNAAAEPVSATWDASAGKLTVPQEHRGVIQPSLWEYAPGRLKMLLRSTRAVGAVCAAESGDYGRTWTPARPLGIPHSNSGLDAVRLADGRIVLACNPTLEGRSPLSLLVSEDNGETWPRRLDLETAEGEFSYPSIIQAADGRLHVVYTYRRKSIHHAVVDPNGLA